MLVVKIGGCNGSGKTSIIASIIEEFKFTPFEVKGKKVLAYRAVINKIPYYILGSYHTACGGMDTISNKEEVRALVEKYAQPHTENVVIFEGLITGKTYGYLGNLSEGKDHMGRWLYAFMDTPFDVCADRVLRRRRAKGNDSPFDAERTMRSTYKSVHSTAATASGKGHKVHWIDHKKDLKKAAVDFMRVIIDLQKELV